jgi:hypothetical protein
MSWEDKFNELKEKLPTWEFLKTLPPEVADFKLLPGGEVNGHELTLFAYGNEKLHRRLNFIYTKETDDFLPEKEIGLNKFRDIRYFTRTEDVFEKQVQEILPQLIKEMEPDFDAPCQSVLRKEGILAWDYLTKLPAKVGGFELFIKPNKPLKFINNAVIILDYSNFEKGDQLVFSYNVVTNSYFAETKVNYIPYTIHDFDSKRLKELAKLLDAKLVSYLQGMES